MQIFQKLNILLLEDDIEFAYSLTQTLELYFNEVYLASNIKEANEIFDKQQIDIVMSDIHLEKENGLDFVTQLRTKDKNIPIIIISGFNDKEYLMRAIKIDVVDYLVKPFDLQELEDALKRCHKGVKKKVTSVHRLTKNIYFNVNKKLLYENAQELPLTAREYLFLKLAVEAKGYILSKEMIEESVYGQEIMSAAALKNLLFRIRKKLGKDFIQTLPELGYKINL